MTTTAKVIAYLQTADLRRARDWSAAAALGISTSSMRRRLRSEGSAYATLVNAEKRRRCVELLAENPHADGWKIADTCGYAEMNAATRAFRQWFGCTLRAYKIALRSAA